MAAARPLVSVQNVSAEKDKALEHVKKPAVFLAPIRNDIVQFVHSNMAKNRRQPYAVNDWAGHQHSAESWGTGRAVARIPRVSGGGTSRSGQGAFGNMCRKGRMFAPTKIWRKWHRKINTNQKRYAIASALAASALPSLVMGRGHRIEQVVDVPLVIDNSAESVQKTRDAVKILKAVGGYDDVVKSKESRKTRAGVGKLRNRRHTMRRGPLVVFAEDKGITRAFRNLPGVELANVTRLNLLQLAPGGHLGRFCIWTKSAFEKLDEIYGTHKSGSASLKDYVLPTNVVSNSDITRIINSDEVQSKVRAPIKVVTRGRLKKNPLKNLGAMVRLNPYAMQAKRTELLTLERQSKRKEAALENKRKGLPVNKSKAEVAAAKAQKSNRKAQGDVYNRIISD